MAGPGPKTWLIGGAAVAVAVAAGGAALLSSRAKTPPGQDAAAAATAVAASAAAAASAAIGVAPDTAAPNTAAPGTATPSTAAPAAVASPSPAAVAQAAPPAPSRAAEPPPVAAAAPPPVAPPPPIAPSVAQAAAPPTPPAPVAEPPTPPVPPTVTAAPPPAAEPPTAAAPIPPPPADVVLAPPPAAPQPEQPQAASLAPTAPASTAAASTAAASPASSPPAATVAMVPVPPAALRKTVAEAIGPIGCALVGGDVSDAGQITLRGVVGGGGEQLLARMIQDAAPAAVPDWRIATAPAAYCRVLDAVRPYARPFGAADMDLTLASGDRALPKDDFIVPVVTAADFAGALSLDYFSSDGSLAHLRFTAAAPLSPGITVSVGDPAATAGTNFPAVGVPGWQSDAPFGTDLLLAVISEHPLFAKSRPESDTSDAYLTDLQAALAAAERRGERIAIRAIPVRTVER